METNNAEIKHTPTPWAYDDGHIFINEKDRDYNSIAHVYDIYKNDGTPEANAFFIVTACNNFDVLIETLGDIIDCQYNPTKTLAGLNGAISAAQKLLNQIKEQSNETAK
ncbi:MAG TPA: hypothetical protein VIQ23_10080 [Hanamia sp.]